MLLVSRKQKTSPPRAGNTPRSHLPPHCSSVLLAMLAQPHWTALSASAIRTIMEYKTPSGIGASKDLVMRRSAPLCCNICSELIPVDVVMVMMAVWLFVILDLPFAAKAPTLSSDHNTKEEADHRHDGAEYISPVHTRPYTARKPSWTANSCMVHTLLQVSNLEPGFATNGGGDRHRHKWGHWQTKSKQMTELMELPGWASSCSFSFSFLLLLLLQD